jgi:hypothetical protein
MKAHFAPTIRRHSRSYKRVSTFLATLVVCATVTAVFFYQRAQADTTFLVEEFNYAAGSLPAVSSAAWVAFSGTTSPQVSAGSLSYPGYPGTAGNKVDIVTTGGEDDYRQFATQGVGTTTYATFLVNVANTTGLAANASTTGDYFAGFLPSTSVTFLVARVSIRTGSLAGTFQLGLRASSTNATTSFSLTDLTPGTTYLVVISYNVVAGNSNDPVNMWINPTLGGVEPAPTLTQTTATVTDNVDTARFFLRQGANSGNVSFDNIRIADTWVRATSIAPLAVSIPHVTGPTTSIITVPITVGDLTGEGVKAYDLQVTFNPAIVIPDGTPFDTAGTRSSTMLITPNAMNPGHLIISAFQATDISGSGTLINLRFMIVGAPGQFTPTVFEDYTDPGTIFHPGFRFNAGTPTAVPTNGSIHVNGPTAASAKISGQIVTPDGQPLGGATVTVTGGAGTVRAITNSNGFYRVENLEAGGFYTVTPSRANFVFAPANRSFSLVGDRTDAVFTGMPINPGSNPLESPEFFVRQQYLDFLSREPDRGGLEYWSAQLRACGNDAYCIETRRLDISAAFFIAQEFQDSGLYIYDVYEGALGRRPDYAEYAVDRRSVVGGPRLEEDKAAFAASFVERAEFNAQYPLTMSDEVFVDALLRTAQQSSGIDLSDARAALINLYNTGATATESRSLVLRSVAEGSRFKETQYNPAFVLMEYYGYLGRNPDLEGYDFWLTVLNSGDGNNYRGMVCSFITSAEYQHRFSSVVTRSNAECGRIAPPVSRPQ